MSELRHRGGLGKPFESGAVPGALRWRLRPTELAMTGAALDERHADDWVTLADRFNPWT